MDKLTRLKELKQLLDDGLLTQEEFDKFKSELFSVSVENQNNDSQMPDTSNEENITVEEKTIDSQVSHVEQVNTESIESEKKYVEELNSSQTNHSYWRYILAIVFFLSGGFYIFYHFALKNNIADEQKTESKEGIDGSQNNSESIKGIDVSKKFIGQTYSYTSNNSFGYETITFSFKENGRGTFVQSHLTQVPLDIQRKYNRYSSSTKHKDSGNIFWKIIDGKIQVEYTYKSSDGVSSDAKEVLVFDENRNVLLDDNDNTILYKPIHLSGNNTNESSDFNEDEYNRQREQAEYESSQAYYNSKEYKESAPESEPKSSKIEETETLFKTTITRSPETRKDIANVFWKKEYTLFDKLTDEPIFPYKKNGLIIYKIYCSTNESLTADYVELTPMQLQNKVAYKFLNLENCNKWIESKKRKLKKN